MMAQVRLGLGDRRRALEALRLAQEIDSLPSEFVQLRARLISELVIR